MTKHVSVLSYYETGQILLVIPNHCLNRLLNFRFPLLQQIISAIHYNLQIVSTSVSMCIGHPTLGYKELNEALLHSSSSSSVHSFMLSRHFFLTDLFSCSFYCALKDDFWQGVNMTKPAQLSSLYCIEEFLLFMPARVLICKSASSCVFFSNT